MAQALSYFGFFPNDWLASGTVQRLTLEEQGAFVRLLCHGWMMDGLPNDRRELALLIGCEPGSERAERLLSRVIDLAWKPDADNPRRLRNDRQERQRGISVKLYHQKCAQMERARSANPRNVKGLRRNKPLHKPLHKDLTENQNQTLLRERAAFTSEPEQQPPPRDPATIPDWERVKASLRLQLPNSTDIPSDPAPEGGEGS